MVKPNRSPKFVADLLRIAEQKQISGYALAKASGLRVSVVQMFLAGGSNPTAATLEALAQALGAKIVIEG